MTKYFYIPIIVLVALVVSCKKEQLPELPEGNDPYYHIAGLINNDSIDWGVGIDNTWITYGVSNINGVDSYYGQITNGLNDDAIRIDVLRPEIFTNGTEVSAFTGAKLNYLTHESGAIKFNFGMNYEQFNYVLIKNEDGMFQSTNQVHFDKFGIYEIGVKFSDFSLSESYYLPVRYGFEDEFLKSGFTSHGNGDTLVVEPLTTEGNHMWFIDDNLVSEESLLHVVLSDGIYQLRHDLKDIYGNEASFSTLIRFKDGEFYWQMKYFYIPPTAPSSHYGNVIVSMKKNGVWYSSDNNSTNMSGNFEVSNISTEISLSQSTGKTVFDFLFSTVLYTQDQSDSLSLPEMTGRMVIEFE